MNNEPTQPERSWSVELSFTVSVLVERIKKIVDEGNVRRLIIR